MLRAVIPDKNLDPLMGKSKSYQPGRVAKLQNEDRESRVPMSLVGMVGVSLKEESQERLVAPVQSCNHSCPRSCTDEHLSSVQFQPMDIEKYKVNAASVANVELPAVSAYTRQSDQLGVMSQNNLFL